MFFRTDSIMILRGKKNNKTGGNRAGRTKALKSKVFIHRRGWDVSFQGFWLIRQSLFSAGHISDTNLRNLSYRCPEATEKMLITSSFSCFSSSGFPPPVNPLKHKRQTVFFFFKVGLNFQNDKYIKKTERVSRNVQSSGTCSIWLTS